MHASGARMVLIGRREAELAEAVRGLGDGASYFVHDITRFAAASALIERITKEHGPITCLVNNAGIHSLWVRYPEACFGLVGGTSGSVDFTSVERACGGLVKCPEACLGDPYLKKPAIDTTPEEFQQVMNTHIFGAHALSRVVIPGMIERKHGSVIFIASMASLFGIPLVVAYAAAKSAMIGMIRTMATELSPHNVRVNAIAPGWIDTAMSRKAFAGDPTRKSKIISRTPMARLGEPDDVGWAAVYITSPAAKFVTGSILPVDGVVAMGF